VIRGPAVGQRLEHFAASAINSSNVLRTSFPQEVAMYQPSGHYRFDAEKPVPDASNSDLVQHTVYGLRALACLGEAKRSTNREVMEFYRQLSGFWKALAVSR
jgi:hypothetical protein